MTAPSLPQRPGMPPASSTLPSRTPRGTGTGFNRYTYVAPPTVTGVSPNQGTTLGGTAVTITGTNSTVLPTSPSAAWRQSAITVVNATTINVTTPPHAAGLVNVAVTTQGGTGTGTNAYTYIAPPTVTAVNPHDGTTLVERRSPSPAPDSTALPASPSAARRPRVYRRQRHHHYRHHAGARRRSRQCRRHHTGRHRHRNKCLHLHATTDVHQREPQLRHDARWNGG
ncbi:MAG: IPT/TIG domain-containing protein [Hyphomicrobium sp.]